MLSTSPAGAVLASKPFATKEDLFPRSLFLASARIAHDPGATARRLVHLNDALLDQFIRLCGLCPCIFVMPRDRKHQAPGAVGPTMARVLTGPGRVEEEAPLGLRDPGEGDIERFLPAE